MNEINFYIQILEHPKTKQQRGITKSKNGKIILYDRNVKKGGEQLLNLLLARHRPKPGFKSGVPLELEVKLLYKVKNHSLWGIPKTTRPDIDNSLKGLQDSMTKKKYWGDDSQVARLVAEKYFWNENAIEITIREFHGTYYRKEE